MSNKAKYMIGLIFWSAGILILSLITIIEWSKSNTIEGWHIFILSIGLYNLLSILTWGIREKGQVDDELDTHIKAKSSRVSYPFLMISSAVIYYFFSDYDNYPLLAVMFFIFVAKPLLEFIYSRKFK